MFLLYVQGPYVPGWTDVMVDYTKKGFLVRFHYPTNARNNDKVFFFNLYKIFWFIIVLIFRKIVKNGRVGIAMMDI